MTKEYDEEVLPNIIRLPSESNTRGHEYRVMRPLSSTVLYSTNKGHNRFTSRVVNDWNKLPENVVHATSINNFKNRLDEYFKSALCITMNCKNVKLNWSKRPDGPGTKIY